MAPPPDDTKPVDPNANKCVFCGRYHGSVNVRFNCLEQGIRVLQKVVADRDVEIQSLRNVIRLQRGSIVLPGWQCQACLAFNGEEKERLAACRACGASESTSTT